MRKFFIAVLVTAMVTGCLSGRAEGAALLVVDDDSMSAFFGFYGSALFADQPEKLWDDTVAWAAGGSDPDNTDVLLFTYDGTLTAGPENVNAVGFYNLLISAGYNVQVDSRLDFAMRTDYTGFELVVFPNFGYTDAGAPSPDNCIAGGLPFITMEPGHTDDLNLGTGVTVFSGTVDQGLVVDNDHVVTDDYGLYDVIWMANLGAPGYAHDVPTDGITVDGNGRVLIGQVPEPASLALLAIGALFGAAHRRRRARNVQ